jgi:hypothetical protein
MPSPSDLTPIRKVDIFSHRTPAALEAAILSTLMIAGCADGAYFTSCAPDATVSIEVHDAIRAHSHGKPTPSPLRETLRDTNVPLSPLAPYAPAKPTNLIDELDAELSALKSPVRRSALAAEDTEETETIVAPLTQPIPRNPTSQNHHFLSSDAALSRIMTANMQAFHGTFPRATQAANRALSPGSTAPALLSLFSKVDPEHRIPAYNSAMLNWKVVKVIQHIVLTEAPLGGSIAAPLLNAFATDDSLDHRLAIQISTQPCLPPGSNALSIITSQQSLGYHALQLLLKFHCCTHDIVSDLHTATLAFHITDRSGVLIFTGLDTVQQILSRLSLLDDTRIDYRGTFSHIMGQLSYLLDANKQVVS